MLIVANPEAAERIIPLGFTNVRVLDHGQTMEIAGGKLRITATAGAFLTVVLYRIIIHRYSTMPCCTVRVDWHAQDIACTFSTVLYDIFIRRHVQARFLPSAHATHMHT